MANAAPTALTTASRLNPSRAAVPPLLPLLVSSHGNGVGDPVASTVEVNVGLAEILAVGEAETVAVGVASLLSLRDGVGETAVVLALGVAVLLVFFFLVLVVLLGVGVLGVGVGVPFATTAEMVMGDVHTDSPQSLATLVLGIRVSVFAFTHAL